MAGLKQRETTIYLAAGCFWGAEQLFRGMPGVMGTCVGYANGNGVAGVDEATYESVCANETGFHETCRVSFDPARTSLDALLYAYFRVIDPTLVDRQGNDRGSQYQAGVFWPADDEATRDEVLRVGTIERTRTEAKHGANSFRVRLEALRDFYPAEECHQDYLVKNPGGYCHISPAAMRELQAAPFDPEYYEA